MPKASLSIFLFLQLLVLGQFTAVADTKEKAYSLGEGITENKYHIEIDTVSHASSLHVNISGQGGGEYTFHIIKSAEEPDKLSLDTADQKKLRALLAPIRKEYVSLTGTAATQSDINEIDFINAVHTKYNNKTDIIRFTNAKPKSVLSASWSYIAAALALGLVLGIVSIKYGKRVLKGKSENDNIQKDKPSSGDEAPGGNDEQDNGSNPADSENDISESINDKIARQQGAAQEHKGKNTADGRLDQQIAARKEAEKQVAQGLKSIAESEAELKRIIVLKGELQQEIERLKSEHTQTAAETQLLLMYIDKARNSLIIPFLQFTQTSAAGPDKPESFGVLLRDVLVMSWQYMALINYLSDRYAGTRRMDDNDKYNLKLYDLQGGNLEMNRQPEPITVNDMPANMPALVRSVAVLLQQYQVKDLPAAIAGILFSSQNQ